MTGPASSLDTRHTGLTGEQARARLADEGPNTVPQPRPPGPLFRVLHQLTDPLVVLLIAAAAVTAALRDLPDTVVIVLVIIVNTSIGVAQEARAEHAVAALRDLAAPHARVVRDGRHQVVAAADLVRGDLVALDAGDVVPADLTLLEAQRLRLDEAALTGESVAVDRDSGDEVYAGTVVVTGRARGLVVRTGAHSALGRISALVAGVRPAPTPLQRRLAGLSRLLGGAVVVLSAVVMLLGLLAGEPLVTMAITAVSLVVAAVPESLPAVVTLALALGARRMARGRAIARRLHAVETLGSVTVVASDKTGTLTEGRMVVDRVVLPDGTTYRVTGDGYEPVGAVQDADGRTLARTPQPLRDLARAALLCNDAALDPPDARRPHWRPVGDPLEAALVAFAARCGLDPDEQRRRYPRRAEEPFDASTRRMVTVHAAPRGVPADTAPRGAPAGTAPSGAPGREAAEGTLVVAKGAPEVLLDADVLDDPPAVLAEATARARDLAAEGLRVLAVAGRRGERPPAGPPADGLHLLGLVAVGDPLRTGATEVAAAFEQAGIRLVVVTGDHPATAAAIAGRLGVWRPGDEVVTGPGGDPHRVRVFARIRPEQKLDIVRELQGAGHVVAVTGDGVNDAPALRRADIGVAMGASGTEVARQAADLILVDDNLGTVALAVREGRRIYDNIRRFLGYGLSGGLAEILVMLIGPFLGLAVTLLPAQILWINLLTHGLPGVALGAEPANPDTMRRPPRPPDESVLGAGLARTVLLTGALITVVTLGAAVAGHRSDRPWQSMAFLILGLAQLGVALAVRAPRRRGHAGNPSLYAAVALSAALQYAGVLVEPLRVLLGTDPLGATELLGCTLAGLLPGAAVAVATRWGRRHPG